MKGDGGIFLKEGRRSGSGREGGSGEAEKKDREPLRLHENEVSQRCRALCPRGILSLSRPPSSMYFDEDGDLAHEFYNEQRVEVKSGVVRWVMRKVSSAHLTPQV